MTRPDIPSSFNLAAYVLAAGADQPEKTALKLVGGAPTEIWSYSDLIAAVRGTASGLLDQGLSLGDRVLMRLGNTPDFPIAYLGALAVGLVPVPTSAALTAPEVERIIEDLQPKAVLHDPAVPCPKETTTLSLEQLRAMRHLPPAPWHMGDPHRLGYIVYTSGTSGKPTAVMHAHRAILGRRMMFDGWYGLRQTDRVMHAGAFNWTYTLGTGLLDPWTMGATALIPQSGTRPEDLLNLLENERATLFAAAPGVFRQILRDAPPVALPDLRHGLSAGEKMAQGIKDQWQDVTGSCVHEAFGMSECSTFISGSPDAPADPGAIGCVQPGRRVVILGPDGPQPDNTPGIIAVHRDDPGLMLGYWNAPAQTAERFEGEWFLTGDQAVQDEAGQITYLGRTDDMMNAGGFRVSPLEVEAALAGYPGLEAAGVTEVNVKEDASVIAAFYTASAPLDEAELYRYAKAKLARYKQPRLYVHVPALPTGANGKLLRRALRRTYEAQKHG